MLHGTLLCVCSWGRETELLIISFSYAEVLFKKDEHWGKQKLFCDFFFLLFVFLRNIYIWGIGKNSILSRIPSPKRKVSI